MNRGHNLTLHWIGSSRFGLSQWERRWRLLPASDVRRSAMSRRERAPRQKVGVRIVPATAKRAGALCMKCKANGALW